MGWSLAAEALAYLGFAGFILAGVWALPKG